MTRGKTTFTWINGRPIALIRNEGISDWPGGDAAREEFDDVASVVEAEGFRLLVLHDPEPTTWVPLKAGGGLLISCVYSEGDDAVARHLKGLPKKGWRRLREPFVTEGGEHLLFDASLRGTDLSDPTMQDFIEGECGGTIRLPLVPGRYPVEIREAWRPDDETELWLVRLVPAR